MTTKDRYLILAASVAARASMWAQPDDAVDEANADWLESHQLYREWERIFDADLEATS